MGCGASKAVATEDTVPQPTTTKIAVQQSAPVAATTEPEQHITEDSPNADQVASEDRPPTPEFTISGTGIKGLLAASRAQQSAKASDEARESHDEAFTERESSAGTVRSAASDTAVVLERPSSRGGLAFDMTFEGQQARSSLPARLEKLQLARTSGREDMSIEQLKEKLAAAENRRIIYEKKLKEKISREMAKVEKVQAVHQEHEGRKDEVASKALEKETKVLEKRQASLQQLRDKLRQKDEHAQKVREQKRLSAGLSGSALATVNA
jgi:hypothetical protein